MFLSNPGIIVPPLKRTNEAVESDEDLPAEREYLRINEHVEPLRNGNDEGDILEEDHDKSVVFLLKSFSSMNVYILTEDIGEDLVRGASELEYISEDDLVDLVEQIKLDEGECKCPNCKFKDGVLRHQSFVSTTAQQILFSIHQLAQPFLSWTGKSSTCLYLVRRDWEQNDGVGYLLSSDVWRGNFILCNLRNPIQVRCLVLQQVGTGKLLICQQHFEVEVEMVEEFRMKLVETLDKVEEDPLACDGLHCRLKKAALVALGNFPTFDLDRLQLERKRLGLKSGVSGAAECAVCLETLKARELVAVLQCKHVFHGTCLSRWVGEGHFSCPICRAEVQEI